MSFLKLTDRNNNMVIVSLDRFRRAYVHESNEYSVVTFDPFNKDDLPEVIECIDSVEDIWGQIKVKM